MRTSIEQHGYWHHINWRDEMYGLDQHGNEWFCKDNPTRTDPRQRSPLFEQMAQIAKTHAKIFYNIDLK